MRIFALLCLLLPAAPALAEQDTRYYWDVHSDHNNYRAFKANEGRIYEWTKPELSNASICMELDSETHGVQYRLVVEDVYCPKLDVTHEWSKPGYGENSRCMKVDLETHGLKFKRPSFDERCEKPKTIYAWLKTENDRKESCYEIDVASRGTDFRRPARDTSCPRTLDPYLAFGRKVPLLDPTIPYQHKDPTALTNSGRMPASLKKPEPEPELGEGDEGIKKYWEDPEDMIEHVPGSSRKGY